MASIYILREILTPVVKGKSFNVLWRNHGYYSSFEKAVELIKDFAELSAEEEAENGVNPFEMPVGYIIEQQDIDVHPTENPYSNCWLFDYKGNHIDSDRLPGSIGKPFRGRPQKYIRLHVGDIVGVLHIDNPRIKLGVVVETPPTPETFADYDQCHPFLHMVDEDDCYNVAFSDRSDSMEHPSMLIQLRTPISTDIEKYFNRVLKSYTQ
ncbi:hypothetical protein [Muribaculum intestinale]|uniref:hypothetical protein n=1 Tax=Muribaculum intestinale TaxID=1796646 RepID=UPI0026F3A07B|nr:hypothetical protein [Muribaculum intestinale]